LQPKVLTSDSPQIKSSGTIKYNPDPADGWLHTDGFWVKDSAGQKVAMRGIHIGWCYYEDQGIVTQNLIDIAKAHGATYIDIGWNLRVGENGYLNLEQLDMAIDLCEANNIYVVLNYLQASSDLIREGLATGWQDVIPIDTWKTIIQRYANRPVVMGVKLLDEPNFNSWVERNMWTQAIETLRTYNPNLLWFTHIITWRRFGEYENLNPWQSIDQVPDNVLIDAGGWVRTPEEQTEGSLTLALDDYATADAKAEELLISLVNWRNNIPIPVGMAYGSSHLTEDNAHTYFLAKSGRMLEEQGFYRTYYVAAYFWRWESYKAEAICDRLLPDAPYLNYW